MRSEHFLPAILEALLNITLLIRLQNCHDRFLVSLGRDDDLDLAFLKCRRSIRDIALGENGLILLVFRYRFPGPYLGEKHTLGLNPFFAAFPIKPPSARRR